ncbi:Polysaccharide deacetylase [Rhizoctonia solani]|uniref:chitin deacetylase n=1 Tax=Rhizoctonia solani TaxID=456999 RepID=A0A8H7IF60_9AGAM|nr:Polysaccharide deacetylase [Rhizoctonia solani]
MRSSAVALAFAGAVAAHVTGAEHSDHIKFLRSLHSSNFPPTPVKRQAGNGIPPLESIGPALPRRLRFPCVLPLPREQSLPSMAPPTCQLPQSTWLTTPHSCQPLMSTRQRNVAAPAGSGQSLCQINPEAALKANAQGNCWWSCGSCTRDTDIDTCPDKMTWGLTFDDGPSPYTPKPAILQATYLAGHEIALHTWSHRALTTLTNEEIIAELGWNKKAIKDVIGVTPKGMRPPYGDIDDRVRAICKAMNLTPVMWTTEGELQYDSNDWRVNDGSQTGPQLLATFNSLLDRASQLNTGFVSLQHDLYAQTVNMAVGYFLPAGTSHNPPFALQSVNECHKKPLSEAYIETSTGSTTPSGGNSTSTSTGAASTGTSRGANNTGASTNTSGALPRNMVSFVGAGVISVLVGGALALL